MRVFKGSTYGTSKLTAHYDLEKYLERASHELNIRGYITRMPSCPDTHLEEMGSPKRRTPFTIRENPLPNVVIIASGNKARLYFRESDEFGPELPRKEAIAILKAIRPSNER